MKEELLAYYGRDKEHSRLREGRDRLEFWRTQDVLRRMLPPAPARVAPACMPSGWSPMAMTSSYWTSSHFSWSGRAS